MEPVHRARGHTRANLHTREVTVLFAAERAGLPNGVFRCGPAFAARDLLTYAVGEPTRCWRRGLFPSVIRRGRW